MPGVLMNCSGPAKAMVKVGMVQLDVDGRVEPVRLTLMPDTLVIEKEELAYTTSPTSEHVKDSTLNQDRVVTLKKDKVGGLGLSVKGGAEHQLPIIISRIFKDQAADRTGLLYVGDAISKVDDHDLQDMTHDEAVHCLKQTGDTVTLKVSYYRPASLFLASKQQQQQQQQQSPGAPTGDSSQDGSNQSLSNSALVPQWNTLMKVPLLWAYVTKYIPYTDQLWPSAFAVVSMDKISSGTLQCASSDLAQGWIQAINSTIASLNAQSVTLTNKSLPTDQKVHYMCWASLQTGQSPDHSSWDHVFLCLKGTEISLFEGPPVKTKDEVICKDVGVLYESMLKVLRTPVGSKHDCVSLELGGGGQVYCLGLEDREQLLALERNWYRCNYLLLAHEQKKNYECVWRGKPSLLELNINQGISLTTQNDQCCAWTYQFSQFKGSSDDSQNILRLHFLNEATHSLELRELECPKLNVMLFAMHAFFAAKLASVDPEFLLPWS